MAQEIKALIERIASYLKERELKGRIGIFFKGGRIVLGLFLSKCSIDISYALLNEGLSTQVIVITVISVDITGFTLSWIYAGASLVFVPALISILSLRSIVQQIINQRDYEKFRWLITQMSKDDELKQIVRVSFMDGEVPTTNGIEMQSWDSEKIKSIMKKEFGLVENPNLEQVEK